jgi:C4-dicarboxylate-specific signal transduction histidine kinase
MEKRYYHKDGSIVWVKLFVSPMWAVGQKPNNHIAVVEDITENKQVEKALKKRRDQLERLVKERTAELTGSNEQLRSEIEERKKAENIIRLNESLLAVLLRLSEMREATVKEMAEFVLEEGVRLTQSTIGFLGFMNDQETVMTLHSWSKAVMEKCRIPNKQIQFPIERSGLWGEVIRQRKPMIINDYSLPNTHKKGFPAGHVKLLRFLVFPIVNRNRVVALIAVANKVKAYDDLDLRQTKLLMEGLWDIKQYQSSKEESQQLREDLSHLTRVATIGELATSLAHELNQPLTAILSNAQAVQRLLKSDTPDIIEMKDALNDIINDNRRASGVIHSLRKFLQQGDIQSLPVDINKIIQETLSLVNTDFVANYISLTLDLFEDLPPVLGDYIQLQQVILNLILNAVEAMKGVEKDSRKLVVRTRCDDPSTVTVVVQDSGIGMDSGEKGNVFNPFFTTKQDGLGMGLSINRTIIEAHAGWIRASQNPEGGAIFSFGLPVYKE